MKTFYPFVAIFVVVLLGVIYFLQPRINSKKINNSPKPETSASNEKTIRFVPIGDSYTIGLGVKQEDRWPNLLVDYLEGEGINLELVTNPAISGYTTLDVLKWEVGVFEKARPDLGTLFIGANDAFSQRDLDRFKKEYVEIVDRMQKALTKKENLILITVPNYAWFPAGQRFGATEDESKIIEGYNRIIREEASRRGLKLVDLYQINSMNSDDYFISDGIHPNAKGIKVWHDAILPVVREVINGK